MNKGVLILSGYNIRAIVAFCRWAKRRSLPFHLIAQGASDPIFLTAFADSVFLVRESKSLEPGEFCNWIGRIRRQYSYQEILVLPSSEFLNRFLLRNRAAIETAGGLVPLVDTQLYERISDKYSFGLTCLDFGIPIPKEYPAPPGSGLFVAKPRSYEAIGRRQLKPYLIYGAADLAAFHQKENEADYYFQEYIEGNSVYLLAYIPRNEKPVLFSQENLLQQANGGSVILARRDDFYKQQGAVQYLELLVKLNFHGLIMIEVRFHKDTQRHFMIEANPRLWGPSQLAVDNGVDIFGAMLRDHGFNIDHTPDQSEQGQYYFWSGGLGDGRRPTYHNYSADRFVDEFSSINRDNLFLRDDTMALFRHELREASELINKVP
jgi:predicted ATP-grasp superfamily ATP-dependent carboligase